MQKEEKELLNVIVEITAIIYSLSLALFILALGESMAMWFAIGTSTYSAVALVVRFIKARLKK